LNASRSKWRERLFGGGMIYELLGGRSVESILNHASCPVLIVQPDCLAGIN